uniref:Uncharacterized protein n=1 Tax=Arundo donax TaxID=35708 RepID=A0A0A9BUX2_ARUDO
MGARAFDLEIQALCSSVVATGEEWEGEVCRDRAAAGQWVVSEEE